MADVIVKKRDGAVDFLKVIATLLVLNSHMGICYGSHSALATGGGIGDALFFFVSGFTLFMGRKTDFVNWYKRRIGRIYPTIIAMGLVACLVFAQDFSFIEIMSASKYWFLQCILVCYLLLFPVIRYEWNLPICIGASIIVMIGTFHCFDFGSGIFYGVNNYFRWIVYLSVMLIGGSIYKNASRISYRWWCLPLLLFCVVAWYGCNYIGKGNALQLLSYIPLIGICVTTYQLGKAPLVKRLFEKKIFGNVLFIIGNLCLESYLIQRYVFTNTLNGLFPLNIPVIMIGVLIAAYFLHIISSIITQIFDSKQFVWNELVLYKK